MILSPCPVILRSLPMMDFSPVAGVDALNRVLVVPLPFVECGPSFLGSAGEARVNMEPPVHR